MGPFQIVDVVSVNYGFQDCSHGATGIMFDRNRPLPSPQIAQSLRHRLVSHKVFSITFHPFIITSILHLHHIFTISSPYFSPCEGHDDQRNAGSREGALANLGMPWQRVAGKKERHITLVISCHIVSSHSIACDATQCMISIISGQMIIMISYHPISLCHYIIFSYHIKWYLPNSLEAVD